MVTSKKPFDHYKDLNTFTVEVVKGGKRPPITKKWPKAFKSLLQSCWDTNPANRPVSEWIYWSIALKRTWLNGA